MKGTLLTMATSVCLAVSVISANAREPVGQSTRTNSHVTFKTEAGDCVTPTAQFDLDINNVRARLLNGGDLWWNLSEARYQVPKGDGNGPSLNAIFAGAIWITGLDRGGNLKCAAQRYRGAGDDYWPGPLTNGATDKATCTKYDRFFNVYGANISAFQAAYATKGKNIQLADIPKDVLSWPAKGNEHILTDPSLLGETFDIEDNLAPFHDENGDGKYEPMDGDYPMIPCQGKPTTSYADQMVFWVFNDMGNLHTESNGQGIGVQVNALAFAYQTTDDINNMTFYKYEITNKSTNELRQTYISQWVDPDLGCFADDRVGCDVNRSLGIVYNGSNIDDGCNGVAGYGSQLPILGVDFFEGPLSDSGTQLGMSSFVYFTNDPADHVHSDPESAPEYRNFMTAKWKDGTSFLDCNGSPTNYMYPDNPSDPHGCSEYTAGIGSGDRRFVQTSGPFTLKPGAPQYVTVGVVFVRPPNGVGVPPNFETSIGPADDKAQELFQHCFHLVDGPDAPTVNIRELPNEVILNLVNLPGSNNFGENFDQPADGAAIALQQAHLNGDSTYTFEGYKVYQLADSKVSSSDLNDPNKARLVAEVDVKNGITMAPTYEKDPVLGIPVPNWDYNKSLKDGNDAGIVNSFDITKDYFATGDDKQLINHKTYYYTAVAFAYNNYKAYDMNNPDAGGQLTTYRQGRGNFRVYSAIPHIADPRNEGTIIRSNWNDGVEVKRIEGQGNGGNNLQLSPETILQILSSGNYAFADTLTYTKGQDPIGFKVTDPVALKEADFELQFYDTGKAEVKLVTPDTRWLLRDVTNNDTILSDRPLDRPYEQQIALSKNGDRIDYGFSIRLGTPVPVDTLPQGYLFLPQRYVYGADANNSSIEFEDPTKQWLSFLKDEGSNTVTNWIRSGTHLNCPNDPSPPDTKASSGVFDDNWYFTNTGGNGSAPVWSPTGCTPPPYIFDDPNQVYDKILNGTWAPYCLTPNYSNDRPATGAPAYSYGPGFKWKAYGGQPCPPQNNLDRLASVDIVITPDSTKWSRCIVFETGEDAGVNQGADIAPNHANAHKGQIRMAVSRVMDRHGHLVPDPTGNDIGRSYFPGYAINVETGERLNMAFGESSDEGDQNGRDMLWNPTNDVFSPITFPNSLMPQIPYFGGKHFIYVMDTKYDGGDSAQKLLLDNYANIVNSQGGLIPTALYPLYRDLMWTAIPYLSHGYSLLSDNTPGTPAYIPPSEIRIKLRVDKPFNRLATSATRFDTLPRYQFSTKGLGATERNVAVAKSALDLIRVVPNPYLGYSGYETDANSSVVKITNLPNRCTVTIIALDGSIVRTLSRAVDLDPASGRKVEISDGAYSEDVNLESALDWDMKNDKGIPISSGIYLFHVEAPGIGQRTLKWFGAVRPADISNF